MLYQIEKNARDIQSIAEAVKKLESWIQAESNQFQEKIREAEQQKAELRQMVLSARSHMEEAQRALEREVENG